MPSSVPSNLLTPASYHEFVHQKGGAGLAPLPLRVLLVGTKSAAGTATVETPVQVFDLADAIAKTGLGSELYLMAAKAFETGTLNASTGRGGQPEVWICPIAAPAGVAAVQTLTVAVTTALAGTITLRIAGRFLFVGVSAGDSANTIAAAIKAAIATAIRELPVTATVATNVVTCTHATAGTNGNDVVYEVVAVPGGVTVTSAQSVAGTGVIDITLALDASLDRDYQAIAISIHSAAAVSDALAHLATAWRYDEKKWRWVFMGDRASLGTAQAYATAADSEKIVIVSAEGCQNLPSEMAAAVAVAAFGVERPNANYDGVAVPLYPPAATLAYTAAEIESALAGGLTPLRITASGAGVEIVRLITTKLTDGGVPFDALKDLAFSRTLAYRATQYDVAYRQRFKQEIIDGPLSNPEATLLARVRDMCIGIDRELGRLGYLRDVEKTVPLLTVTEAASPAGRLEVNAPATVAGPLHQTAFRHVNLYL